MMRVLQDPEDPDASHDRPKSSTCCAMQTHTATASEGAASGGDRAERDAIAFLLIVAACPPRDWQGVAEIVAAQDHGDAVCASGCCSPRAVKAKYERIVAAFRHAVALGRGDEWVRSSTLRRLLERFVAGEDARRTLNQDSSIMNAPGVPECHHEAEGSGEAGRSSDISMCRTNERMYGTNETTSPASLPSIPVVVPSVVVADSDQGTRKRKRFTEDAVDRRVAHRVGETRTASGEQAPASSVTASPRASQYPGNTTTPVTSESHTPDTYLIHGPSTTVSDGTDAVVRDNESRERDVEPAEPARVLHSTAVEEPDGGPDTSLLEEESNAPSASGVHSLAPICGENQLVTETRATHSFLSTGSEHAWRDGIHTQQYDNMTEVEALKRQLSKVMMYVHNMHADFQRQVSDLSVAATASKSAQASQEEELNELRNAYKKLEQENLVHRVAIARLRGDHQLQSQRNIKLKAAFIVLTHELHQRKTENARLKQEMLTVSYRTTMLERTVEACETLLRGQEEKLEANDRKFATLGCSFGSTLTTIQQVKQALTKEAVKLVTLAEMVDANREVMKNVVKETKQLKETQDQTNAANLVVEREVQSLANQIKVLNRLVQETNECSAIRASSIQISSLESNYEAVTATLHELKEELSVETNERLAFREALDAQRKWHEDHLQQSQAQWEHVVAGVHERLGSLEDTERKQQHELTGCQSQLEQLEMAQQAYKETHATLVQAVNENRSSCVRQHVSVISALKSLLETDI